jgi:glyoxylase-like metal-dependent hydrolase (beta-lactamase superfamily II)
VDEGRDLGDRRVRGLILSRFRLDGGSMFGQVPKPIWNEFTSADGENRIPLVLRALLVETPAGRLLIDAGMGGAFHEAERARLAIDPSLFDLRDALRAAGVAPESIAHLLLTHLHFDHVGGLTAGGSGAASAPTLPQARVWLHRAQWERAHAPGPKERRSLRAADLAVLERMDRVLLDEAGEILPGVFVRPTLGHTTGLLAVTVRGTRETLHYPSDLMPLLAHVRLAYTTGFDLWPERLMEEKQAILAEAAAGNDLLVFNHDPRTAACRVAPAKDGFVVRERVEL